MTAGNPMRFEVAPAPHTIGGFTVPRVMFQVLVALVPAAVAHVVLFGPGLLLQIADRRRHGAGVRGGRTALAASRA